MSKIIKWGHFSDLHFKFNETFSTKTLRDSLIKKIEEYDIEFDFICITGDIANKSIFSEDTLNYIEILLDKTGCKKENLYISCGNHDIAHILEEKDNYNIFNINTCILSGQNDEEGKLLVCDNDLYKLSENKSNNVKKLNIAIGHHGIDCIHKIEQKQLISFFDNLNIDMYLCGHNHEIGFKRLEYSENEISQFMCGGVFRDYYNTPSFMITECNLDTYDCKTTIYEYSTNNFDWNIKTDIGYPFKNGIYNYIPKRLHYNDLSKYNEIALSKENYLNKTILFDNKENFVFNNEVKYYNNIFLQLLKFNNNVTNKIENKNNLFQNNSAYIKSIMEEIDEKIIVLCERIYNKFFQYSKYYYLGYLYLLFLTNNVSLKDLDNDMGYNIVNDWNKLINELLNDFTLEINGMIR